MNIPIPMIVFIGIVAILPALIVLVVCMLRIEATRGDAKNVIEKFVPIATEQARISAQFQTYTDRISTLSADVHAVGLRMSGWDEALASVNNKLSSRERADRLSAKRKEDKNDSLEEIVQKTPGVKQPIIDFSKIPGAIPLPQPPARPVEQQPERPFGVYPDGW